MQLHTAMVGKTWIIVIPCACMRSKEYRVIAQSVCQSVSKWTQDDHFELIRIACSLFLQLVL